jgi:hypothetical protein
VKPNFAATSITDRNPSERGISSWDCFSRMRHIASIGVILRNRRKASCEARTLQPAACATISIVTASSAWARRNSSARLTLAGAADARCRNKPSE